MRRPDSIRGKKWQIAAEVPPPLRQQLSHIHPVLLQVLYNRQIDSPARLQAFLEGQYLESTDPFLLAGMEEAVARVEQAVAQAEQIVVYGDFDADGVTATVLLTQALRGLGLPREQVRPYIPDRVDEGYGLNTAALTAIRQEMGAGLVISVDCGIRSAAEIEHARAIGLDVVVTDHHSLGREMPAATAIINPKRPDSTYPEKWLAGVGLAYKLAQALQRAMPERAAFEERELLDLVALGTVADLAPLRGENRVLVTAGLQALNEGGRPGVAALAEISGLKPGSITAEAISFGLGPRINAAGRLAHAYLAAKLLAANNSLSAKPLAHQLNDLNRKRQQLTSDLAAKALAMVDLTAPILVAADASFKSGVVGLVASRLVEQCYRPAIVLEKGEVECTASCRSIAEFDITRALDETADLLVKYGGHARAAGFTVRNENLALFIERISAVAARELDGQELQPSLAVDAVIPLDSVDWALQETLLGLEPTGAANPAPLFVSRGVEVMGHRAVGREGTHLQMQLSDREGSDGHRILPAIAFRQGAWASALPQYLDIAYSIGVNEWNGRRTLQLRIEDMEPAAL